jgi:hypothetical protein
MRFLLRIVILVLFALAGRRFGKTLEGLLGLAAFYCTLAGAFRREAIFGDTFTHFDEAAAYAVIAGVAQLLA